MAPAAPISTGTGTIRRVEAGGVGNFDQLDNASDILEKVDLEAGPEAASALAKVFGIVKSN